MLINRKAPACLSSHFFSDLKRRSSSSNSTKPYNTLRIWVNQKRRNISKVVDELDMSIGGDCVLRMKWKNQ